MRLRRVFAVLAGSLLVLVFGVPRADAREGGSGYSGRSGQGRLSQRNQQQTQREEEQKQREEERQKQLDAKKQAAAQKLADAKKKADAARLAKKQTDPTKTAQPKTAQPKNSQPDTCEQDAAKLCDQAEKKFAEGKMETILEGASLLQKVLDDYGSTEAAGKAEGRLEQLLAMPDLGSKILLAQANELFGAQRYRKAQNKFTELLDAFPDSPEAAEAKARLAEIRNGNLLEKTVYTEKELEDARLWLLAGNIHQENSRPGDAVSAWRKVTEQFPGCRYAKEAGEHLAGLPKS
jgi:TolA-binding protein